jgi:RNA polymerase sigma factor (sigma-70 family)
MRVAQHWSLCRDDALDAYQRALEIYLRRLDSLDPATEIAWLKVVVKHEALAVRRQRAELLPVEQVDAEPQSTEAQRPVDDVLAARERVRRSAEALRRIKADEAKALVLKGQGLSYREIGESLGWTYTKVNRALTEGRARFLRVYSEIEAGEECERFAPTLAALVGGTASAEALLELRPHIRNCPSCRATVRDLHATRLGRLRALWPIPALLAPLRRVSARFGDGTSVDGVPDGLRREEIPDLYALVASPEAAPLGAAAQARPRLAESALQRAGDGVANLKQHAIAGYSRAVDLTPLAGARPGAAAAAIAGCIAIGSGTTYCVTQGVDPIGGLAHVVAPAREHKQPAPRKKREVRARVAATATPSSTPVAIATPAPEPAKPAPQPTAQPTTEPAPEPTPPPAPPPTPQEEYEPVAPATTAAQSPPKPSRTPAPAPASGPGEFDGP